MNLKVNSTVMLFMALSLKLNVVLGFQKQESAKSFQEIARLDVNEETTPEQIIQFNAKAERLGFSKVSFLEKRTSGSKIIFSNGTQLNLKKDLESVNLITKDYVIIREMDRPRHGSNFIKRVYDHEGEFLFSQNNDRDFFLIPTEMGYFFRVASHKPISLHSKSGQLINTFSNSYTVHGINAYVSPDKRFLIINSMVEDYSGSKNGLIAIDAQGKELWRKNNMLSTLQLAISNDKVAIGERAGIVYVFDRNGNPLREYPTEFKGDLRVTYSADGKYLAAVSVNKSARDKSSYIYLFDDENGVIMPNWPIHVGKGDVRTIHRPRNILLSI
ncbi:hypothetical protein IIC38_05125 [candidate division KSB1 bacterium]|nr:hypothetical protein [candidate division KSB1 bacterium]